MRTRGIQKATKSKTPRKTNNVAQNLFSSNPQANAPNSELGKFSVDPAQRLLPRSSAKGTIGQIPLPTDPQTLAPVIAQFLKQLNTTTGAPYVHEQPITFVDGHSKHEWRNDIPDGKARDTYSALWASKHKGKKKTWIAMVSMPIRNWVANPEWDKDAWHCWGLALIKPEKGFGKHVIIWDCDPRLSAQEITNPPRLQQFMLPTQLKLIKYAQSRGQIKSIWYNTDLKYSGQNRCLEHTLKWISEVAGAGDRPFAEDGPDSRVQGCTKMTKL